VSTQENRGWQIVHQLYQQNARQELDQRPGSTISEVGMDEFAIKKGHRHDATVIVDLEHVEIIYILEYRDPEKLGSSWILVEFAL
jgi:transposase